MRCDFERRTGCLWQNVNLEYFGVRLENGFYWRVDTGIRGGNRPDRDHTTGQGIHIRHNLKGNIIFQTNDTKISLCL